jgi:hypothetical protein
VTKQISVSCQVSFCHINDFKRGSKSGKCWYFKAIKTSHFIPEGYEAVSIIDYGAVTRQVMI